MTELRGRFIKAAHPDTCWGCFKDINVGDLTMWFGKRRGIFHRECYLKGKGNEFIRTTRSIWNTKGGKNDREE